MPRIEVVARPPGIEAIHGGGHIPEGGTHVSGMVVKAHFNPAVPGQGGESGQVLTEGLDLSADVGRSVMPVAGLEVADAVLRSRPEDRLGRWQAR